MSLRVQKTWKKIGSPAEPGDHHVQNLGVVLNVTAENIQEAGSLGNPIVVLENQDSGAFVPEWKIVEIRGQ